MPTRTPPKRLAASAASRPQTSANPAAKPENPYPRILHGSTESQPPIGPEGRTLDVKPSEPTPRTLRESGRNSPSRPSSPRRNQSGGGSFTTPDVGGGGTRTKRPGR